MAKIIKEFPHDVWRAKSFGGDAEWFNGQVWQLDYEEDLMQDYKNLEVARGSLIQYARSKGLKLRTRTRQGTTLIIQAYTPEEAN